MPWWFDITDASGSKNPNGGGSKEETDMFRADFVAKNPIGFVVGEVYKASAAQVRSGLVVGLAVYGRKDGSRYEMMSDGSTRDLP